MRSHTFFVSTTSLRTSLHCYQSYHVNKGIPVFSASLNASKTFDRTKHILLSTTGTPNNFQWYAETQIFHINFMMINTEGTWTLTGTKIRMILAH